LYDVYDLNVIMSMLATVLKTAKQ